MSSTWAGLASNQLVDKDAIADAIANGVLQLVYGQSAPSGNQCITVSEAETLLLINPASMPGGSQMPVKSDFVPPASSTLKVVFIEESSPEYVDVDGLVVSQGSTIFNEFSGTVVQDFTLVGGSYLQAQASSSGSPSGGADPIEIMQVLEDGIALYNNSAPSPDGGSNLNWAKSILPGSHYDIFIASNDNGDGPGYVGVVSYPTSASSSMGDYTIVEMNGTFPGIITGSIFMDIAPGSGGLYGVSGTILAQTLVFYINSPTGQANTFIRITYNSDGAAYNTSVGAVGVTGPHPYNVPLTRNVTAPDAFKVELLWLP